MARFTAFRSQGVARVFLLLLAYLMSVALTRGQQPAQENPPPREADDKETITGCLSHDLTQSRIGMSSDFDLYVLTGATSGLEQHPDQEVTLEGATLDDPPVQPRSFKVTRILKISAKPKVNLSRAFAKTRSWKTERSPQSGITFSHPTTMEPQDEARANDYHPPPNFATQQGTELVARFDLPPDTYTQSSFFGGEFAILTNSNLTNRGSCMQFGEVWADQQSAVFLKAGNVRYAQAVRGGAALGLLSNDYQLHTFQNGLCYEVAFEFLAHDPHTSDEQCRRAMISDADESNVIRRLLGSISFFTPAEEKRSLKRNVAKPRVTAFSSSSLVSTDQRRITLAWNTANTDYIELRYSCVNTNRSQSRRNPHVLIVEDENSPRCLNIKNPSYEGQLIVNHSPNGSASIYFVNGYSVDPMPIVISVIPYSHGKAYPSSGKSLTIAVDPEKTRSVH